MGQICYYLATSIDGYLAREDGSVDWLNPFQFKLNTPYDYKVFYKTVSAVIMGRKTWEVSLSFEPDPFSDKARFVVSKSLAPQQMLANCRLLNQITAEEIRNLKRDFAGRIWLVGGADLATQLLEMGELDEIVQTIVPVSLGRGIHWFKAHNRETPWKLAEFYQAEKGVVQLVYSK